MEQDTYEFHRLSIMSFLTGKHRLREIFGEDYAAIECRQDIKDIDNVFGTLELERKHICLPGTALYGTYIGNSMSRLLMRC